MRRMEKVTGRSDDMVIVRGVNMFPTQIEEQLLKSDVLTGHYQIVLTREGRMDEVAVHVEARPEYLRSGAAGSRSEGGGRAHQGHHRPDHARGRGTTRRDRTFNRQGAAGGGPAAEGIEQKIHHGDTKARRQPNRASREAAHPIRHSPTKVGSHGYCRRDPHRRGGRRADGLRPTSLRLASRRQSSQGDRADTWSKAEATTETAKIVEPREAHESFLRASVPLW